MYEKLCRQLRVMASTWGVSLPRDAADAIEERDRYALTIQHEMMAEAESHIALVERLNKQIEELSKRIDRAVELYNHGVEKSAMYEALKGISPEPPKEET